MQHCGGTQPRSNRKLLIVPRFLLSNLGLYLSISLLLVSLIMQTKHKCGARQPNSWPRCSSWNCTHSYRCRQMWHKFKSVRWAYKLGVGADMTYVVMSSWQGKNNIWSFGCRKIMKHGNKEGLTTSWGHVLPNNYKPWMETEWLIHCHTSKTPQVWSGLSMCILSKCPWASPGNISSYE